MKRRQGIPPLTQDVLDGLRMGLFQDDVGRSMLRIWQAGVCDARIENMIEGRVHNARMEEMFRQIPFRPPQLEDGELTLGLGDQGNPLSIAIQYLNANCLTVAGAGGGKTTRTHFYALQVAPRVRGLWLIDLRKREFRILQPYLARLNLDLIVLPARALRINPLQVPFGVDPAEWIPRLADMHVQVLGLPPRASKLMQTSLFVLYRRFGVFDGAAAYPTLFDLLDAIRADKDGNPNAKRAFIDSLEPVLWSLGPDVLAYRRAWPVHELARRHIVLELGGIGETEKNLILNYLVLAEFTSRVVRSLSNPRMDLWISCDEAQRLCTTSQSSGRASGIEDLIGLVRGTGIGLDLSLQSAANLSPHVIANTATKLLGRCTSAADCAAMGHCLGLTSDQIRWAQHHLTPGMFIGQIGEGRWRQPFVFTIPPLRLSPQPDATCAPNPGALADLPVLPA